METHSPKQKTSSESVNQAQYLDYCIVAAPEVAIKNLSEEDRHVPGVYSVEVDASLAQPKAASVALDVFHSECAVDTLDDFTFYVFDPRTGLVLGEDEDHKGYSGSSMGRDLVRIGDAIPKVFAVGSEVGDVVIVATSKKEARAKVQEHWQSFTHLMPGAKARARQTDQP